MLVGMMLALSTACGGVATPAGGPSTPGNIIAVDAANTSVPFGYNPPATVTLEATVVGNGTVNPAVTWQLEPDPDGCGQLGATVTQNGVFTAPTSPQTYIGGSCKVLAVAAADPTKSGVSTVTITAAPISSPPPPGITPAFAGAQGGGALSKGGRGGVVYRVTNLNDSGPGSLRACVEATGPRTCVFQVAGVINLSSGFTVTSPYLTVAGQTAPGDGIALYLTQRNGRWGDGYFVQQNFFGLNNAHDVVIRHLRMWADYTVNESSTNPGSSGVAAYGGSCNVVVDHVSILWMSWSEGGAWRDLGDATNNGRISVQWSLLGEAILSPNSPAPQAIGWLSADQNYDGRLLPDVDLHHNIFVTNTHRNPGLNGSGRVVNNLMYNWQRAVNVDSGGGESRYDFVNNYFKPGPMSPNLTYREIQITRGTGSHYVSGNKSDWNPNGRGTLTGAESDGTQWSLLTAYGSVYQGTGTIPAPDAQKRSPWAPLPSLPVPITVDPAANVQSILTAAGGAGMSRRLDCLGNWVDVSDSARDRIIAYIKAGTGPSSVQSSTSAYNGGGPLPTLATGTPCADTDGDGIPDAFEMAACGTTTCLNAQAVQADGYTNLEHYLNGR